MDWYFAPVLVCDIIQKRAVQSFRTGKVGSYEFSNWGMPPYVTE